MSETNQNIGRVSRNRSKCYIGQPRTGSRREGWLERTEGWRGLVPNDTSQTSYRRTAWGWCPALLLVCPGKGSHRGLC